MIDKFTLENLGTHVMLCFLQAVLDFDKSLYISIESQRAPVAHQKALRFWGIILALALCVVLLFVMIHLIDALAEPFHIFAWARILEGGVNFATCVFVIGGVLMNLIFSFDPVLSALAITDVFAVLATAIILLGLAMLWLSDGVTRFLKKPHVRGAWPIYFVDRRGGFTERSGASYCACHAQ